MIKLKKKSIYLENNEKQSDTGHPSHQRFEIFGESNAASVDVHVARHLIAALVRNDHLVVEVVRPATSTTATHLHVIIKFRKWLKSFWANLKSFLLRHVEWCGECGRPAYRKATGIPSRWTDPSAKAWWRRRESPDWESKSLQLIPLRPPIQSVR